MSLFAISVIMTAIWAAVSESAALHNLLLGFVLSLVILSLLREQLLDGAPPNRTLRILSLVWLFLVELAKSAWKVAVMVTRPKLDVKPGIFAYPLTVTSDLEITLLANLITLTPGTLSVDVSDDRKTLYVHAIDCADPDAARLDIANGFERKIREAFA
ncbi:Na+/H+ antiporter subunit E [Rhizobium sp. SL42]|uniref:Na+/H+ antiporter subunit E n=1 Tax=Rhizobium sp. SL42 TaxID=2806346 RepID=UPI001F2AAC60|nr:Na+/H+ antiporter subunit E [Rhizobium sp. SL42]UJW76503.1 Na+/H+ antiporter subunit E [Rhizobium sp. SL42]